MRIADFIIDSRIGALDRALGFLFGAARGILVVAVGLLFFNWLVGANPPAWIAEAKSRPFLESIGDRAESLLPDDPENSILKKLSPERRPGAGGDACGGDRSRPAKRLPSAARRRNAAAPPTTEPDDSARRAPRPPI